MKYRYLLCLGDDAKVVMVIEHSHPICDEDLLGDNQDFSLKSHPAAKVTVRAEVAIHQRLQVHQFRDKELIMPLSRSIMPSADLARLEGIMPALWSVAVDEVLVVIARDNGKTQSGHYLVRVPKETSITSNSFNMMLNEDVNYALLSGPREEYLLVNLPLDSFVWIGQSWEPRISVGLSGN